MDREREGEKKKNEIQRALYKICLPEDISNYQAIFMLYTSNKVARFSQLFNLSISIVIEL